MTMIQCARCWKEIEKKWPRKVCIPCRRIIDRELQIEYRNAHLEEIRKKEREYWRRKRAEMRWEY